MRSMSSSKLSRLPWLSMTSSRCRTADPGVLKRSGRQNWWSHGLQWLLLALLWHVSEWHEIVQKCGSWPRQSSTL
jgi:hypothetical protein